MNVILPLRKFVWSRIAGTPSAWWIFTYCSIAIAKIEMNVLFRKNCRPKLSLEQIFRKIFIRSRTCHILGNGEGSLKTLKYIRDDECVIAMNSGVFHPVHIDIYMTELHNDNDSTLKQAGISLEENIHHTRQLYDVILERNPGCLLIIKNMMYDNVSPCLYDPQNQLITLPEVVYKFFPLKHNYIPFQKFLVGYILNDEKKIIIQTSSTVTTAVTFAYKAGFQKIYIHGLDGGGSHYFHNQAIGNSLNSKELEILSYLKRLIPKVPSEVKYEAGGHSQGTLPLFVEIAKEAGVSICRIEEVSERE